MFRTVFVRGLILVLVLVLGAPLAFAAGSREPEGLSVRGVVSALWEALVELVPSSWMEAVSADPDPTGGSHGSDSGPGMDPNGKPTGP